MFERIIFKKKYFEEKSADDKEHEQLPRKQVWVLILSYTDPKWKLYIVFKSIYFDDKLSFGVNVFGHRIFNALSMSLKKFLDENHKLHNFYEQFSSEGSKWKFLKTIKTVTQILETRNYWLRALSDVKKNISNQCDLHFYEC